MDKQLHHIIYRRTSSHHFVKHFIEKEKERYVIIAPLQLYYLDIIEERDVTLLSRM